MGYSMDNWVGNDRCGMGNDRSRMGNDRGSMSNNWGMGNSSSMEDRVSENWVDKSTGSNRYRSGSTSGRLDLSKTLGVVYLRGRGMSGTECLGLDKTPDLLSRFRDRLVGHLASRSDSVVEHPSWSSGGSSKDCGSEDCEVLHDTEQLKF